MRKKFKKLSESKIFRNNRKKEGSRERLERNTDLVNRSDGKKALDHIKDLYPDMELWHIIRRVLTATEEELREMSHIINCEIYFDGDEKKWTVIIDRCRICGNFTEIEEFQNLADAIRYAFFMDLFELPVMSIDCQICYSEYMRQIAS